MRAPAFLVACAAALLLGGCSLLPHHKDDDSQDEEQPAQDVGLHVDNHNWSDIVVFAVRGTSRMRLGDVATGTHVDFVVPRNMVIGGSLTVLLHPIGGPRDFSTGPILVAPGQDVDLRVENSLVQTNWSVS